jgi:hypothetical protein
VSAVRGPTLTQSTASSSTSLSSSVLVCCCTAHALDTQAEGGCLHIGVGISFCSGSRSGGVDGDGDRRKGAIGSGKTRSADGEPAVKRAAGAKETIAALRSELEAERKARAALQYELDAAHKTHAALQSTHEALCLEMHGGALRRLPRRRALPVLLMGAFRAHGVAMLPPLQQLICDYSK